LVYVALLQRRVAAQLELTAVNREGASFHASFEPKPAVETLFRRASWSQRRDI
jgi:hypothetical protein